MKYLNKRKFPRGIKRLHAGSQLLLHIGSTLEKGTRVTRGDYSVPVCLKDTTAKWRKALGRICRTTNVIKELRSSRPTGTKFGSRLARVEGSSTQFGRDNTARRGSSKGTGPFDMKFLVRRIGNRV